MSALVINTAFQRSTYPCTKLYSKSSVVLTRDVLIILWRESAVFYLTHSSKSKSSVPFSQNSLQPLVRRVGYLWRPYCVSDRWIKCVHEAIVERHYQGKPELPERKPVPVCICPPQTPRAVLAQNRVMAVTGRPANRLNHGDVILW